MPSIDTPLSPHLQVYKPQLTSILSITHRATGVVLSLGALVLCYCLISIANGIEHYSTVLWHLKQWYGILLLLDFLFCIYYHLLNGIRHLFWDMGAGLELETSYRSGYAVIFFSILFTAITAYVRLAT